MVLPLTSHFAVKDVKNRSGKGYLFIEQFHEELASARVFFSINSETCDAQLLTIILVLNYKL